MNDRRWIRAALERYEGPLILHARRITGDLERARDAVQETFLRLCSRPRAEVEPHLAEWLFTVCRNVALDLRKKERVMEPLTKDRDRERPSAEPSPAVAAATDEQRTRVLALLDSLPEKQREVLRLKFQAGLSYKEIQGVTGHSLGNVGYLVHMGLKSLRDKLSGSSVEELAS